MKDDDILTTLQAAKYLGVSRSRIYQYINEGRLPAQRPGRDWFVLTQDVKAFERQPVGYPKGKPRNGR